jgi:serine/threonine protein kinase
MDPRFTPEQISHYKITKKLGDGVSSIVYEAVDVRNGQTVAVKIFGLER